MSRVVQVVAKVAVVTGILIAALFVASAALIGSAVHAASRAALQDQPGDPVLALMAFVESPKHTWQERNRAVWALGQTGDTRALSTLKKHFTGEKCDHAHALCQHELGKAIRLCNGATNLTAPVWR